MERNSESFLIDPSKYLKSIEQKLGYDKCHRIEGIDASVCAADCEKLKRTYFAKDCRINGGLFKCCIR